MQEWLLEKHQFLWDRSHGSGAGMYQAVLGRTASENRWLWGVLHCTQQHREHFRQPIVDYINPGCLVSKCVEKRQLPVWAMTHWRFWTLFADIHIGSRFDFKTITIESLHSPTPWNTLQKPGDMSSQRAEPHPFRIEIPFDFEISQPCLAGACRV